MPLPENILIHFFLYIIIIIVVGVCKNILIYCNHKDFFSERTEKYEQIRFINFNFNIVNLLKNINFHFPVQKQDTEDSKERMIMFYINPGGIKIHIYFYIFLYIFLKCEE